jgi:hypothetical protein
MVPPQVDGLSHLADPALPNVISLRRTARTQRVHHPRDVCVDHDQVIPVNLREPRRQTRGQSRRRQRAYKHRCELPTDPVNPGESFHQQSCALLGRHLH